MNERRLDREVFEALGIGQAVAAEQPTKHLIRSERLTIRLAVGFWASEDSVLREIYGVAAIDPAARDLVARQRADRRGEMARLARHLDASAALRAGTSEAAALGTLMVLTSYSSYRELREEGLDEAAISTALQLSAGQLLLALSP